jgi:D-alanine-D-alanine ligase
MPTPRRTRVLVLYGGRSAEHEISILSARFIVESLDRERFEPVLVGITKAGRWTLQDEASLRSNPHDPRAVAIDASRPEVILPPMPAAPEASAAATLLGADGRRVDVDVAFPVLHGPMGEDGCMQGLFELGRLPYVGAGVLGSALGMDKAVQKRVLAEAEIPVVRSVTLAGRLASEPLEPCEALGYPLFVKPANMGSSLGIRRARDRAELEAAVAHALEFDTKVLVEQGLDAPREIECAVLGNDEPVASIPGEIGVRHRDGFYSYDAKYIDDGAELIVPALLHRNEVTAVQLLALRAFRALECAGMARVDLFLTADRDIYLNEINTIPGFTAISMYPRLWAASGLAAEALVSRLVELGLERHAARARLRVTRE